MLEHLPTTWDSIPLDSLTVYVLGGDWGENVDYDDPDYVGVRCIRASELRNWESEHGSTAALRKIKKSSLASRELQSGDIVVEVSGGGPEQPVGRTALINLTVLAKNSEHPKICTNFFRLIRPAAEMNSDFLNFYLKFFYKTGKIAAYQRGSNNLRNLKFNDYLTIRIPIPPAAEQRRIVAKIEELFSELDKGVENLKTARAKLNVYRQAVLKHAFEGKLTAQWREEDKDKLEKPEQLLARIKQEREARYEQQLKKWRTDVKTWEAKGNLGKKPSKPRPLSFSEAFTNVDLTGLPEIPSLWCWAKVGELFSVYVGATPSRKNPAYWNGDINWISSGEVCFATISRTNETITREGLANTSTEVHPIGTVMLGMIGEGKTRGQAAITNIEACHNQNTAAIRVSESDIQPEYVYYYLLYRYEHTRRVGSGNNQRALNKERVSNLPIPLSSLHEQAVVIQELERHLSVIAQLDSEISSQLASTNTLRQAILEKAFTGQLVPQDSSDEPASVLLDRIKAEKEQASKSGDTIRKTRKKRKTIA